MHGSQPRPGAGEQQPARLRRATELQHVERVPRRVEAIGDPGLAMVVAVVVLVQNILQAQGGIVEGQQAMVLWLWVRLA